MWRVGRTHRDSRPQRSSHFYCLASSPLCHEQEGQQLAVSLAFSLLGHKLQGRFGKDACQVKLVNAVYRAGSKYRTFAGGQTCA